MEELLCRHNFANLTNKSTFHEEPFVCVSSYLMVIKPKNHKIANQQRKKANSTMSTPIVSQLFLKLKRKSKMLEKNLEKNDRVEVPIEKTSPVL